MFCVINYQKEIYYQKEIFLKVRMMLYSGFRGCVVVVLGGTGFLGQHIVKELHQRSDFDSIRVMDVEPFSKKLSYDDVKPLSAFMGSILNADDLHLALKGTTVVIHAAGAVDVSVFPDRVHLHETNINGTKQVLDACIDLGVPYLLFTSTVDVLIGYEDISHGDDSLFPPQKLLFKDYGGTKLIAERHVMAMDKTPLKEQEIATPKNHLKTMILRPTCMYGEGDPYFVLSILKATKEHGGTLQRIGDGRAKFQTSYVGNVAVAHLDAIYSLKENAQLSGSAFIITDDTPALPVADVVEPFLACRGFKSSKKGIPYFIVYTIFWFLEFVLRIIRPLKKVNVSTSLASIVYVNRSFTFERKEASEKLKYKPVYTYEDSVKKSILYYKFRIIICQK